jgi:hypothetical protein
MMTDPAVPPAGGASKAVAGDVPPEVERMKRLARPPLERAENLASTSSVSAKELPMQHVINRLLEPVQSGDDPEQAKEILEQQRQALIEEALAMQQERDNFNQDLHEYEAAQGFTPITNRRSRVEEVRARGRDLNAELEKDNRTKANSAVCNVSARNKLKYSSPAKNLRAIAAVTKKLPVLSGEALREQQARLNELLSEENKQQEAFKKANPGTGASQYIASMGGAGARSRGQASSPHQGARRVGSVTSGHRDKQIQVYDPAIAEKQAVMQGNVGQGERHVDNKNAGQNYLAGQGACSPGGGQHNNIPRYPAQVQHQQQQGVGYTVQHHGGGQPRHREDDGNSTLARTGYQQPPQQQ